MGLFEKLGYAIGYIGETLGQKKEEILFSRANPLTATIAQAEEEIPGFVPLSYGEFTEMASDLGLEPAPDHLQSLNRLGINRDHLYYDPTNDKFVIIDGNPKTELKTFDPNQEIGFSIYTRK